MSAVPLLPSSDSPPRRRRVPPASAVVALLALVIAPGRSSAQQDTVPTVETGDRIRIWSDASGIEREEFSLRGAIGDSLVLLPAGSSNLTRLDGSRIDSLQVRVERGSHFWEGVLVGAGAGVVTGPIVAAPLCDQAVECYALAAGFLSPVTVLPGAIVGGWIGGTGFPEHDWISVEVAPALDHAAGDAAPSVGLVVRIAVGD